MRRIGDLTEAEGRERQARMEEVRAAHAATVILGRRKARAGIAILGNRDGVFDLMERYRTERGDNRPPEAMWDDFILWVFPRKALSSSLSPTELLFLAKQFVEVEARQHKLPGLGRVILGEFLRVTGEGYANDDPEDAAHRARAHATHDALRSGERFSRLRDPLPAGGFPGEKISGEDAPPEASSVAMTWWRLRSSAPHGEPVVFRGIDEFASGMFDLIALVQLPSTATLFLEVYSSGAWHVVKSQQGQQGQQR